MKVLITGSSGLVGSALAKSLAAHGHDVIPLPRRSPGSGATFWDPDNGIVDLADLGDIDAVVHLAGDNISTGRWTEQKKSRILHSRVNGTELLARHFAASAPKPRVFVCASAVGIYGNRGPKLVDETSGPGDSFLADVCRHWEQATAPAADAGIRVANLRFGVVLSATGGALKKMLTPFKMGLGGIVGSGAQYMSWVSIDDALAAIQHVIATDAIRGPVNLVSPNPVSNRDFTKILGRVLHRPTILPLPAFAARIALGEMADELLLAGARVTPKQLMANNYHFLHPQLQEALQHILRPATQ